MSGTESESDGEVYSYENQESQIPSQARPPPVGQNKIQELILDNRELRKTMRKTAFEFEEKRSQLERFYSSLKAASKSLNDAYMQAQAKIQDQDKKITFLQADKIRLRQEIRNQQGTVINRPQDTNGNEKEEEEYKAEYNDTVSMLSQQLTKSEEDKTKLQQQFQSERVYLEQQWNERERQITEWDTQLQRKYQDQIEVLKVDHSITVEQLQNEVENEKRNNKQTFLMLSGDIKDSKQKLKTADNLVAHLQSSVQSKEERIFQMSQDAKSLEEKAKSMTEEIIRLKQSLEDTQRRGESKEESLDQLFKVYNEEREQKQQLDSKVSKVQEELDRVLAQYLCAEESLKRKNEEIDALKTRVRNTDDGMQVSVYKQQADIFKKDFEMEREARQKLHQECESLKAMVVPYQMEMQRMKQELMRYQNQMQQFPPPR